MSAERQPGDERDLDSAEAVRERAHEILAVALEEKGLEHFAVRLDRLEEAAERVARVTRAHYPTLDIPYHGRLAHFEAGGYPRASRFTDARELVDRVVVSVLLDAGAGPRWRYREEATGLELGRSEGLAVATLDMFSSGLLSGGADELKQVTPELLGRGFQVSETNPLVGLEGRARLLNALGAAIARDRERFGFPARVGNFADHLSRLAVSGRLPAPRILNAVLQGIGGIWPGRGDVFFHSRFGWVPFHKLSQWLTYSLIEPLERGGLRVIDLDGLTGLAEYRNGGLFVDTGVLEPRHDSVQRDEHAPDSEVVVEWRGLTVALLDRVAEPVRDALGMDAESLPLAKVLEGGTWRAGREVAFELRPDGAPPIRVRGEGLWF